MAFTTDSVSTPETSVDLYETTRRKIPEGSHFRVSRISEREMIVELNFPPHFFACLIFPAPHIAPVSCFFHLITDTR